MSDEASTRRDNALDFLDELDERHDYLLNELDQLNLRIDAVLNEYSKSRQSAALANGIAIEQPNTELIASTANVTDASNDTPSESD